MAYVFPSIENRLAGQTDDTGKIDIFGQPQGAAVQGQPQTPGTLRTETGGDVVGGSGVESQTVKKAPDVTPAANARKVMQANVGTQQGPTGFTEGIANDLRTRSEDLQNKSNAYAANYAGKGASDYGYDPAQVQKAVTEGGEAFSGVMSRLRNATAPTVAKFETPNVTVPDLEKTKTEEGLGQALRARQDERYAQGTFGGEEALDRALLRKNPAFQQQAKNLREQQAQLQASAASKAPELEKTAQANVNQAFNAGTDAIRNDLNTRSQSIMSLVNQALAEENARREAQRAVSINQPFLQQQNQEALAELGNNWGAILSSAPTPEGLRTRSPGYSLAEIAREFDPAAYYKRTNPELATFNEMVRPEQADQYNRIMDLLGNGGQAITSGPQTRATAIDEFNKAGYEQAIADYARSKMQELFRAALAQQTYEDKQAAIAAAAPPPVPGVPGAQQMTPIPPGGLQIPTGDIPQDIPFFNSHMLPDGYYDENGNYIPPTNGNQQMTSPVLPGALIL